MMTEHTTEAEATVGQLVRDLNQAWLDGRIDELQRFFAEDVVTALQEGSRIVGREAVIASFRRFTERATTHSFEEHELVVDTFKSTAVATLRFRILYEVEGDVFDEIGREYLVLERSADGWRVVWRTQILNHRPIRE